MCRDRPGAPPRGYRTRTNGRSSEKRVPPRRRAGGTAPADTAPAAPPAVRAPDPLPASTDRVMSSPGTSAALRWCSPSALQYKRPRILSGAFWRRYDPNGDAYWLDVVSGYWLDVVSGTG